MQKKEGNCVVKVEPCGLIICSEKKFLASSPDGIVVEENGDTGLLEIKNLLQNKPLTIFEAASTIQNGFCLQISHDHKLHLKRTHDYYYQVQGQMNIGKKPWTDFVVRTEKPYQLFIERIYRDETLWKQKMLPKLEAFYNLAVLPELAVPTYSTLLGIREPGLWYTDSSTTETASTSTGTLEKTVEVTDSTTCTKSLCKKVSKKHVHKHPQPSSSRSSSSVPSNTCSGPRHRSGRLQRTKFVGRRICHEWIEDEQQGNSQWYNGTVTSVKSGRDGDPNAVYEVLYDGDDQLYIIDHLLEDLQSSSLKFIDLW